MKTYLIFLVIIFFAITLTCEKQLTEPTSTQNADIEKQVRTQWEQKFNTLKTMNLESWDQLFSKQEFLGYVSGGHFTITSRQAFMDSTTNWWNARSEQNGELVQIQIHPLSSDLALVDVTSKWHIVNKNGSSWRFIVTNSLLYRKEAEGWKIIYEQEALGETQ